MSCGSPETIEKFFFKLRQLFQILFAQDFRREKRNDSDQRAHPAFRKGVIRIIRINSTLLENLIHLLSLFSDRVVRKDCFSRWSKRRRENLLKHDNLQYSYN